MIFISKEKSLIYFLRIGENGVEKLITRALVPRNLLAEWGDIKTVVRCLKLLIGLGYVDGSGKSDWSGMLWGYVWLTPDGIFYVNTPVS